MKKFYSLVYRKEDKDPVRLYESESLKKVEEKKIDYSFEYNTDFLFIEEIYIGSLVDKNYEPNQKKEKKDNSALYIGLLSLGSIILSVLAKKLGDKKHGK